MILKSCLRCGCQAELLLNVMRCTSPRCQNFDVPFFKSWLSTLPKTYKVPSENWLYLGTFNRFDLYANGADTYAVFGSKLETIFAGNALGEPFGFFNIFWSGPEDVTQEGREALREAAARKNI